jgi:hypothetical protein
MTSPKGSTRSRRTTADKSLPTPVEQPIIGSPSLEVLETLEIQNALSALEMRMDSLEIDTARQQGSREDDARRIAGEMAVMRARVEDALAAFAGTADDLRDMVRAVEKRIASDVVAEAPAAFQAQLSAGIDGVMAGVGDALETFAGDVRTRVEQLGTQMAAVQATMGMVADTMVTLAPLASRITKLEQTIAELSARAE